MFSSRSNAPSFSNHCGCTKWCNVASGSIPKLRSKHKHQDYRSICCIHPHQCLHAILREHYRFVMHHEPDTEIGGSAPGLACARVSWCVDYIAIHMQYINFLQCFAGKKCMCPD